jgi:hypothetical protein
MHKTTFSDIRWNKLYIFVLAAEAKIENVVTKPRPGGVKSVTNPLIIPAVLAFRAL